MSDVPGVKQLLQLRIAHLHSEMMALKYSRPVAVLLAVAALKAAYAPVLSGAHSTSSPPMTGVTILVHGFTFRDGRRAPPLEYWGGDGQHNIAALLNRFGSGMVWLYNPASGAYDNVTDRIPRNPWPWEPSPSGEQVLLFDWTDASDEKEAGQAEAAADVLFASLMAFRVNGERIITSAPYRAVRPLHFIGHSRGTVVVSEAVQRLGLFNIRVHYVTYLDVHDFGQPGILNDEYFHDPAVQVWENVDYADAVYQMNPAGMCGQNPAGRPLAHFSPGPRQRDITSLTALTPLQCNSSHPRPHAWVKDYYWGTVALDGGVHPSRPDTWFQAGGADGSGRGFGFDLWLANGGYRQGRDPSIERVKCVSASDPKPFAWQEDRSHDRGYDDRNDVPPVLFNGELQLPDLDRGVGGVLPEAHTMAGWSYFGGGGNARVRPLEANPAAGASIPQSYFALHDGALEARHNRFFLPPSARELRFAMSVPYVPNTPLADHTLEVRMGATLIRRFTVAETDGFEVRTANLRSHPQLLGRVNTLAFKLFTVPGPATALTARVHLDNINIVLDPTGWIDSISREADHAWRIDWRCWPPGTFYLESKSDLGGGPWRRVANSPSAATDGFLTFQGDGQAASWFRGSIVPAR